MFNGTDNGNLVPWTAIQGLWEKKASPIKYLIHLIEVYGDGVMGVQHVISAECLIMVERTSIVMSAEDWCEWLRKTTFRKLPIEQ